MTKDHPPLLPSRSFPHKRVAWSVLAISAVLLAAHVKVGHNWGGDFAGYIMQSKSLVDGTLSSYLEANRIAVEESSGTVGPRAYPWGLPLLLVPVYLGFGMNIVAMKLPILLCYFLFVVVLWYAFSGANAPPWRLSLLATFALHPGLIGSTNSVLSDVPFLFASTLGVWLVVRFVDHLQEGTESTAESLCLGLWIVFATTIRTNGILLLPALLGGWAVVVFLASPLAPAFLKGKGKGGARPSPHGMPFYTRGRSWWHLALVCLVCLLGLGLVHVLLSDGGASHMGMMQYPSYAMLRRNVPYYFMQMPNFFARMPWALAVFLITLPLSLIGAGLRLRQSLPAILYILMTLMLYSLWPSRQGLRFLYPILPFYVSYMLVTLAAVAGWLLHSRLKPFRFVCVVPAILMPVLFGWHSVSGAIRNLRSERTLPYGPYIQASSEVFATVRAHTEADAVIQFFKPRVMHMMTNRRAFMSDRIEDVPRAGYLCIYSGLDGARQIQPAPEAVEELMRRRALQLLFQNTDFSLYKVFRDDDVSSR